MTGDDEMAMGEGPEPWASDPNVPTRQPAFCPYCGQDGSFGGLGRRRDHTLADEEQHRHHCPECGNEFITVRPLGDGDG